MSRPWQEAVTELVSTGLTQHQLTLLLEVVTGVTRHVTQRDERDGASRSSGAIRAARYRKNLKSKELMAEANDAAITVTDKRDASRDTVTNACDLSSLSESVVEQRDNREERTTASIVEGRKKVSRGTRLPPDAQITSEDRRFALEAGMTDARIVQAWAEFVDYWTAVPGQRGTKLNWSATWRNRVRAICGKGGVANGRTFQDDSLSVSKAIDRRLSTPGTLVFPPRPSLLPVEREDDRGLLPPRRSAES